MDFFGGAVPSMAAPVAVQTQTTGECTNRVTQLYDKYRQKCPNSTMLFCGTDDDSTDVICSAAIGKKDVSDEAIAYQDLMACLVRHGRCGCRKVDANHPCAKEFAQFPKSAFDKLCVNSENPADSETTVKYEGVVAPPKPTLSPAAPIPAQVGVCGPGTKLRDGVCSINYGSPMNVDLGVLQCADLVGENAVREAQVHIGKDSTIPSAFHIKYAVSGK